jgi:outer membrane protein OmpA-like peptidoglycan-associated protein
MLWQKGGYGLHVQARKALGYTVSARFNYTYGIAKGLDWQVAQNYGKNPAYTGWENGREFVGTYNPQNDYTKDASGNPKLNDVFYAYKMEAHQFNFDLVFSLNNILFNKANHKTSFYAFGGLGAFAFQTWMNTRDANGNKYDFNALSATMAAQNLTNHTDRVKAIQAAMDGSYDADAQNNLSTRKPGLGFIANKTLLLTPSFGLGMEFKISSKVSLQFEDRISFSLTEDKLDGQQYWGATVPNASNVIPTAMPSPNTDNVNYFSAGLNFQLGNKAKRVASLWWLNPLDYVYNEISNPRHMKVPPAVIADEDGDGVADQLDKGPNTPAGQAVDVHGVPMDTDGDGVPDFRDRQLITPTECQPVDADGVGNCPCPSNCQTIAPPANACNIVPTTLEFDNNSAKFSAKVQAQLVALAAQMNASPSCKVVVAGNGNVSKSQQQRSWERVEAVIVYMSEKHGIDRNRFIFQYAQTGDANTVNYRAAAIGEDGPVTQAPPFPNLVPKK